METGKHTLIAIIFLIFLVFIISVGLFVYLGSKDKEEGDYETIKNKVYEIRAKYFYIFMAVIIILLGVTLNMMPYSGRGSLKGAVPISIVGGQWYWKFHSGTIKKNGLKFNSQSDLVIPVNKTIDFQVTSLDVNHGFGIFTEDGTLLTQVQAMPDFVNNLKFKFTKPGIYHIVCMEYCGMAHQGMLSQITVK